MSINEYDFKNLTFDSAILNDKNVNMVIEDLNKQMSVLSTLSNNLSAIFDSFKLSDEIQDFLEEAKKSEKLSEKDFESKYSMEIDICKKLGNNGWVVSSYSNPSDIMEWNTAINKGDTDIIINFFESKENGNVLESIINSLEKIYTEPSNIKYFSKGIKAFNDEDYMTSAMYLVALVDVRVCSLVNFPKNFKYYQKFSDVGFAKIKKKHFREKSSFFIKRYYFLNIYPSLISYLHRLFVNGIYQFDKDIEPPYINRNWLLHGRNSRNIERYECIQILNALDAIESVLGE